MITNQNQLPHFVDLISFIIALHCVASSTVAINWKHTKRPHSMPSILVPPALPRVTTSTRCVSILSHVQTSKEGPRRGRRHKFVPPFYFNYIFFSFYLHVVCLITFDPVLHNLPARCLHVILHVNHGRRSRRASQDAGQLAASVDKFQTPPYRR